MPAVVIDHSHCHSYAKTVFGFWTYLMTDCILFSVLFAVYWILHPNTFGGPSPAELFSLPYALGETLLLLTSSFTCGLARVAAYADRRKEFFFWLGSVFVFGLAFMAMEFQEFRHFLLEGHSWRESAFLSSYFTLVGTHGCHIAFGLLWLLVLAGQIAARGVTPSTFRRLTCFSLFWHFLDVVWIFIFTLVYLGGSL